MRPTALAILAIALPLQGQVLDIGSPATDLVIGQTIPLTIAVTAPDGRRLTPNSVTWTSSDEKLLAVDANGKAIGKGLGVATVTARTDVSSTLFGSLEIQVVPSRIELTPFTAATTIGGMLQMKATAFDWSGAAVPEAPIRFELTGQDGLPTSSAVISPAGLLTGRQTGIVTVHALVEYPVREGKASRFKTFSQVTVAPKAAYSLSLTAVTASAPGPATLSPSPGIFSGNASGKLAFTASASGRAAVMLTLEQGKIHSAMATGVPSWFSGGTVNEFQAAALNSRGDLLFAVPAGPGRRDGALFLEQDGQLITRLLDGMSPEDTVQDLSFFYITPQSINNRGEIVFRALFRRPDQPYRDGLFRIDAAGPVLLWSTEQALPGLRAPVDFVLDYTGEPPGWQGPSGFGIDDSGDVTFMAQDRASSARALFRIPAGSNTPVKLIASGDVVLGSRVKVLTDTIVQRDGVVAFRLDLENGVQYLARIKGTSLQAFRIRNSPNFRLLAADAVSGLVFVGAPNNTTSAEGLYRWDGNTQVDFLLGLNTAFSTFGNITYFEAATLSASGQVQAVLRTATEDFLVVDARARSVLLRIGSPLPDLVSLHIRNLSSSTAPGYPFLLAGSPSSIFALDNDAVSPRVLLGQRIGSIGFDGAPLVLENSKADTFFVARSTVFKLSGPTLSRLAGTDLRDPLDRAVLSRFRLLAVNGNGDVLFDSDTDRGVRRVYLLRGTTVTRVLETGTPLSGSTVTDWSLSALADDGGVMMLHKMASGAGILHYQALGGQWQAVGNLSQMGLYNRPIVSIQELKTIGNRFLARFHLVDEYFESCIAEWGGGLAWRGLIGPGLLLPDGGEVRYVSAFHGNSRGDLVFLSVLDASGVLAVNVLTDGVPVLVHSNLSAAAGRYLVRYGDVQIRDDGRVHFLGFTNEDETLVYTATPLP